MLGLVLQAYGINGEVRIEELGHGLINSTWKVTFFYAGKFMIYMQALRFLTDHLLGDPYYGAKYKHHNYNRAHNQIVLLQRLLEKERVFSGVGNR